MPMTPARPVESRSALVTVDKPSSPTTSSQDPPVYTEPPQAARKTLEASSGEQGLLQAVGGPDMSKHDTVTVSRELLELLADSLDRTVTVAVRAIQWDDDSHSAEGQAVMERIDLVRFQLEIMAGVRV